MTKTRSSVALAMGVAALVTACFEEEVPESPSTNDAIVSTGAEAGAATGPATAEDAATRCSVCGDFGACDPVEASLLVPQADGASTRITSSVVEAEAGTDAATGTADAGADAFVEADASILEAGGSGGSDAGGSGGSDAGGSGGSDGELDAGVLVLVDADVRFDAFVKERQLQDVPVFHLKDLVVGGGQTNKADCELLQGVLKQGCDGVEDKKGGFLDQSFADLQKACVNFDSAKLAKCISDACDTKKNVPFDYLDCKRKLIGDYLTNEKDSACGKCNSTDPPKAVNGAYSGTPWCRHHATLTYKVIAEGAPWPASLGECFSKVLMCGQDEKKRRNHAVLEMSCPKAPTAKRWIVDTQTGVTCEVTP